VHANAKSYYERFYSTASVARQRRCSCTCTHLSSLLTGGTRNRRQRHAFGPAHASPPNNAIAAVLFIGDTPGEPTTSPDGPSSSCAPRAAAHDSWESRPPLRIAAAAVRRHAMTDGTTYRAQMLPWTRFVFGRSFRGTVHKMERESSSGLPGGGSAAGPRPSSRAVNA
jgi:hypothetical protein